MARPYGRKSDESITTATDLADTTKCSHCGAFVGRLTRGQTVTCPQCGCGVRG